MKKYRYYQPNKKDLKDSYGDCTIRALTKTTGKTWLQESAIRKAPEDLESKNFLKKGNMF